MLPASYCTVDAVLMRYPPVGSINAISSAQITYAIGAEQARIDAKLGGRYTIPFVPTPPVIEMICGDLAALRIIGTRVLLRQQTKQTGEWTDPFKHSLELLDQLANGEINLVSGSGTVIIQAARVVGVLWSSTMNNTPTFIGQDFADVHPHDGGYWR